MLSAHSLLKHYTCLKLNFSVMLLPCHAKGSEGIPLGVTGVRLCLRIGQYIDRVSWSSLEQQTWQRDVLLAAILLQAVSLLSLPSGCSLSCTSGASY
jgi:hypothetical protein